MNHADPIAAGRLVDVIEIQPVMLERINTEITHDPARGHYPESFAEFVRYQFERRTDRKVLVLPAGATLGGDLTLDWTSDWVRNNKVVAMFAEGDLRVDGDITNRVLEGGPLLLVAGELKVNNLIKAGSSVLVLGDLNAKGLVVAEYNDGGMRVHGDLIAAAYILLDHDGSVDGQVRAPAFDDREDAAREFFVDAVLENDAGEDEDLDSEDIEFWPEVDLLYRFHREGKSVLRAQP